MIKGLQRVSILTLAFVAIGCGPFYRLQGHSSSNAQSPPPLVMKSGEHRKILSLGLERHLFTYDLVGQMKSDDEKIVDVDRATYGRRGWIKDESSPHAWIVAKKPGKARVYYVHAQGPTENKGFQVTVLKPTP